MTAETGNDNNTSKGNDNDNDTSKGNDAVRAGRGEDREADFSAPLLTTCVSSFGRNDNSWVTEKNSNRRSFDFAQDDTFTFRPWRQAGLCG